MNHDIDDRELVSRISGGDTSAYKIFINRYQKLVIHIVYRMVTQQQDREDLVQDVFMKAYRALPKFRFESQVSTWVGKIAYNICLNHLQKKKAFLMDDSLDDSIMEIGSEDELPDDVIANKDFYDKVHEEVENLPVLYRTIITLYHLEQFSYKEISDILELPEGTVKSYLFRARSQLRERLSSVYKHEVMDYEPSR